MGYGEKVDAMMKAFARLTPFGSVPKNLRNIFLANAESEDVNAAHAFLEKAFGDLNSSKLLREARIYNNAVYHIQQCAEKSLKALALRHGIINKKEAKEAIGHRSPEIFLKLKQHLPSDVGGRIISLFNEYLPEAKADFNSEKWLREWYAKEESVIKLSETEIMSWLSDVDEVRKIASELEDRLSLNVDKMPAASFGIAGMNRLLASLKRLGEISTKTVACFFSLLVFGILTYPHEAESRYPSEYVVKYDENLGIVKTLDDLLSRLEKALNDLREMFDYYESQEWGELRGVLNGKLPT